MKPIVRHSPPTKLDQAPFGTECKVFLLGDEYELFIQYSHEESNPRWESMGIHTDNLFDDMIIKK